MTPIVLASASKSRATLLRAAGLDIECLPANVDEEAVKQSLKADGAGPGDAADALAALKAERISLDRPDTLVIGADQMLECNGAWFDKPENEAGLRAQLLALRGETHSLISSVCVTQNGRRLWAHQEVAAMIFRTFSDEFLDGYIEDCGESVLDCVGGYRLEGKGVQLFDRVDGDYFAILGLPLLPLLAFLRQNGAIQ